jgi:hypothetical protein
MSAAQKGRQIPAQLELLLTGISDNDQRLAIIQAFYSLAEGDPNTWPVQFATLIKAHTLAMNRLTQVSDRGGDHPPSTMQVPDLQPAVAKILEAADTLTRLSAERIKWGLLLAWGFGLLSYPLIQFLWTILRQIAHF